MKKLLFLGGSLQQIPVIEYAKNSGIYVITCDYLPDNPGHKLADEYYNVSTTDKEKVLELARRLAVDGVVCYASDPAAPVCAYVCEQLGLPGNPYDSVEILSNKHLFRKFLEDNNFATPVSGCYDSYDQLDKELGRFKLPVMVKPVDSSGSKGVTCVYDISNIREAYDNALIYSRKKLVIVEEYVLQDGYQVAGDGFSVDGKLVFWCFGNDHFGRNNTNPYVPVAASFPINKGADVQKKIHETIQRALTLLKMKNSAYNFDIRVGVDGEVYLMEIGARNGGNYIPQVIEHATGVSMVEYTVRAALGDKCDDLQYVQPKGFWSYYAVHCNKEGKYEGVDISDHMKPCIVDSYWNYQKGDAISKYTGSNATIGILIMQFDSEADMLKAMDCDDWINVKIC